MSNSVHRGVHGVVLPALVIVLSGLVLAAPAQGAGAQPPTCSRVVLLPADSPPLIDGDLGDPCWLPATALAPFVLNGGAQRAPNATECRMTWDDTALYVSFRCRQDAARVSRAVKRDAGEALGDDWVGLAIMPPQAREPAFIAVTAGNVVYDALGYDSAAWNCASLQTAVSGMQGGWQAELSIPWSGLGVVPDPDAAWRVAAMRFERSSRAHSGWPYMRRAPFEASRLAEATFAPAGLAVTEVRIDDALGDLCRPANAVIRARNRTQETVRATAEAWVAPPWRKVEGVTLTLTPGADAFLTVPLPAPSPGGCRTTLTLRQGNVESPMFVAADLPLAPTFLEPRLERARRVLSACEDFLLSVVTNLAEVPDLLGDITGTRRSLRLLESDINKPGVPSGAEYQQQRAALQEQERKVLEIGRRCAVIASYSPAELTAGRMERRHLLWATIPFSPRQWLDAPDLQRVGAPLRITATPGEIAFGTFGLLAEAQVEQLTLECGDLRSGTNTLAASAVELFVVSDSDSAEASDGLGLLVKDDRLAPDARDVAAGPPNRAATSLAAGRAKRGCLRILVPRLATPGVYLGVITASAADGTRASLPVQLRVLPFELPATPRNLVVDFPFSLSQSGRGLPLPLFEYQQCLQDVASHGFTQATLRENPEELSAALALRRQERLLRPAPYLGGAGSEELLWFMAAEGEGVPQLTLPVPPVAAGEEAERLRRLESAVVALGGATIAMVMQPQPPAPVPWADAIAYGEEIGGFCEFAASLSAGGPAPSGYYWWDATAGQALRNRLLCGAYLWASPFAGAIAYSYQSPPGPVRQGPNGGGQAGGLTVAGAEGPVSTLAWEACREGVADLRYLHALQERVMRAEQAVARAQTGRKSPPERLRVALDNGKQLLAQIASLVQKDPEEALRRLPADTFHAFRAEIATRVVLLDNALQGAE